jgi:hypothetical protein
VQVVELGGGAGVDRSELGNTEVAALFGQTTGFKASSVPATVTDEASDDVVEDDDF